jgi:glutamate formiminotransferase
VEGIAVLDVSSDASHNRTVITFVAPIEKAVDGRVCRHPHSP